MLGRSSEARSQNLIVVYHKVFVDGSYLLVTIEQSESKTGTITAQTHRAEKFLKR